MKWSLSLSVLVLMASIFLPHTPNLFQNRRLASTAQGVNFTLEELMRSVNNNHIETVDEAVTRLPEAMRSNFTLVYDTRSLQSASFSEPRAILSMPDGKLTCAFNGGTTLECFQFRTSESRFDFHEIEFSGPGKPARISELNQTVDGKTSCTQCHGNDPRPNWEAYPHWKGAFGSHDDLMDVKAVPSYSETYPADRDKIRLKEAEGFQKFLKNTSPRYQALIFDRNSLSGPYLKSYQASPDFRPNLRLTYEMVRLVALRNARIIWDELPKSFRYEFPLIEGRCDSVLPDTLVTSLPRLPVSTPNLLAKYVSAGEWSLFFRYLDYSCSDCGEFDGTPGGEMSPTETGTQSAGTHPSTYDFYTGGGYDGSNLNSFVAEQLIVRLVREGNSDLKEFWSEDRNYMSYLLSHYHWTATRDFSVLDRLAEPWILTAYRSDKQRQACTALANSYLRGLQTSPSSFNKLVPRTPDEQIAKAANTHFELAATASALRPEIIKTCMTCHQTGIGSAPPIPFDQPVKIQPWLARIEARTKNSLKPMPPYGLLEAPVRDALITYLKSNVRSQ